MDDTAKGRIAATAENPSEHGEFHLATFDLLAEEFRRATNHEARDEDRENRKHDQAIKS
jgi:hypothetical protein